MNQYRIYRQDNYIFVVNNTTKETQYGFTKEVFIDKSNINLPVYRVFNVKDFDDKISINITQILKEDGTSYTQTEFETFYTKNTGNFNQGGSGQGVQTVTGSSVDNTDPENPVINAVEEAPQDGETYGRQDGNWVVVSGAGGNQTLDEVLVQGNTANDQYVVFKNSSSLSPVDLSQDTDGYLLVRGNARAYGEIEASTLKANTQVNTLSMNVGDYPSGNYVNYGSTYLSATNDFNLSVTNDLRVLSNTASFRVPVSGGNATYNISKTKPDGSYILSTIDDINLQNTLTGGRTFTGIDGTSFGVGIPTAGFIYSSANEDAFILKDNDYFSLQVKNPTDTSIVKLLMEKIDNGNSLEFSLPTDKPSGDYVIATLDDIISGTGIQSVTGSGVDNTDILNPKITNYIKSNESLTLARRKDDVLYGILDQYTGEEITLYKITGTPTVDNIIYFQLGSEYFKRSYSELINVKWFGAKGDGINDDTALIQNGINYVVLSGGGKLFFPNGVYVIGGNLVTSDNRGGNPNSQLYIPASTESEPGKTSIEFIGESNPNFTPSGFIGTFTPTMKGVVLLSTLTSTTGVNPSVIGTSFPGGFLNINYTNSRFQDITVLVDKDPAGNGPVIGGINMSDCSTAIFDRVVVSINGSMTNNTNLPTVEIAGICTSKTNAEFMGTLKNVMVVGFRYGLVIGEHTTMDQVAVCGCFAGFIPMHSNASIHAGHVEASWCKYPLYFPTTSLFGLTAGSCPIVFENFTCECWSGTTKWNELTNFIYDPNDSGRGFIRYHITQATVGTNNALFSRNGGRRFVCSPVINPLIATETQASIGTNTPSTFVSQNNIPGSVINLKGDLDYSRFMAESNIGAILALADLSSATNAKQIQHRVRSGKAYIEGANDIGTAVNYMFMTFDLETGKVGVRNNSPSYELDITGQGRFSGTVIVPNAVNSDEAVNLSQLNGVITNTVSSASMLSVVSTGKVNYHTFTGSTSTYTAPAIIGNTTKRIVIINQGTGDITLNSNTGTNDIWESGVLMASLLIPKDTTVSLYNNSINWSVLGA